MDRGIQDSKVKMNYAARFFTNDFKRIEIHRNWRQKQSIPNNVKLLSESMKGR